MATRSHPDRSEAKEAGSLGPASRGLALRLALAAGAAGVLAVACALPGRPVRVLPEIEGRIAGGAIDPGAQLMLAVIHRESASLHARQERALSDDGRFRFDPVFLEVAGHEFSKHYRVYLHLRSGGSDRVIWRAELSRLAIEGSIPLACDLGRPVALGEVCRVADPLRQPWLLAEGRDHFVRLCARCHGADGTGPGKPTVSSPSPAAGATPDLTRIAERQGGRFEPDRVAAWIEGRSLSATHSRGGMPVWGERLSNAFAGYAEGDELIGATLDPIVAYLESLQRERGQPSD